MTKKTHFKLVNSLPEVLLVRRIRNECRTFLTNYTKHIGILRQIYWFFTYYFRAQRSGLYRIFLARNQKGVPLGYGALQLKDGELLVTECVAEKFRGQGFGKAILGKLIDIAKKERRPLIAEIWASNKPSIGLHQKCGFTLVKTGVKSGFKLCTFRKGK